MSGGGSGPVLGPEMRAVRRELAGAADARVLQVLRYVDTLQDRGQADGLLAPLRDRLRRLRPSRPLRFARVLFTPLDPAIIDARQWRPGVPLVPRSAIHPMASLVQRAAPGSAAAVEAIIANTALTEPDRVHLAGRVLWPEAARVLRTEPMPAEWQQNALPAASYPSIATGCALCLAAAPRLLELSDPGFPPQDLDVALNAMLIAAEPAGALPWGMLLTVLLQRFPNAEAPRGAAIAPRADRAWRETADGALQSAWTWIEQAAATQDCAAALDDGSGMRRQATMLERLAQDPAQRRRALALQTELREVSLRQLDMAAEDRLLMPLRTLSPAQATEAATLCQLEQDARALRRMELDIRRLGHAAPQEARLQDAAAAVAARADLPPVDRARLIEILLGPEAAITALRAAH